MQEISAREELARAVTEEKLDELQASEAYRAMDVRYVFRKLRDRYNAVPTLANLLKWLDTETDSRSFRRGEDAPRPSPYAPAKRDRACPACHGTGYVHGTINTAVPQASGGVREVERAGVICDREGKPVRCDHGLQSVGLSQSTTLKPLGERGEEDAG